ncbi:MAG: hypothetical protein ACLGI9_07225 [Thermoanaerobaculia bacterium]
MTVRGRVWLLPALLDYVAREAELADLLIDLRLPTTIPHAVRR